MEKKNTLSSIHNQTPSGKMLWQPKELYGAISMQARVKKLLSVTSLSNSINQQVTGTQRLTTFLPHMISWTALDPGPHPICTGAIGKFHLPPALSEKVLAIKTPALRCWKTGARGAKRGSSNSHCNKAWHCWLLSIFWVGLGDSDKSETYSAFRQSARKGYTTRSEVVRCLHRSLPAPVPPCPD